MFVDEMNILDLLTPQELEDAVPPNIRKIMDKAVEGYERGLTWPDQWEYEPGGPWVYGDKNEAIRKQAEEENVAWCKACEYGRSVGKALRKIKGEE